MAPHNSLAQLGIPLPRVNVHQHGAAGIGHIGYVLSPFDSTRQIPNQPSVDRAKQAATCGQEHQV